MKNKNNVVVLVLLLAIIIIIFSISDKVLFLEGMQFEEIIKYPEISATVTGANTVCGVILYYIGVNISERKKKLKIFFKTCGVINTVIPAVLTLIMLFYI